MKFEEGELWAIRQGLGRTKKRSEGGYHRASCVKGVLVTLATRRKKERERETRGRG